LPNYVRVAVNVPLATGVFDYHLSEELSERVQVGCLVVVPLGTRRVQGVVLQRLEEPEVLQTRPVEALLDDEPVLTAAQLALAQWMAEEMLTPLALCIDLMLPAGLRQHADRLYVLQAGVSPQVTTAALQHKILLLLQERGPLRGRQLEALLPHRRWQEAVRALVRNGWVVDRPVLLPPQARPRLARTVYLMEPPHVAQQRLREHSNPGAALERRLRMVQSLAEQAGPVLVTWVYAESGGNAADLRRLEELGLVRFGEEEWLRDPLQGMEVMPVMQPPTLTQDQQTACAALFDALRSGQMQPFLLHGVTGSGKTEIYLQAVAEALRLGRQALVLVPEISLTPQTVRRFMARFPGQVGLVHSQLSDGERYDTWRRARRGELPVVVGPRSALFTPLPNLGLIVLDECHDASYAQNEAPFYNAVTVAETYARLVQAVLVLGSATPSVEQAFRAQQQHWTVLKLPLRLLAHRQMVQTQRVEGGMQTGGGEDGLTSLPLPPVTVVDMREELKAGNRLMFSRGLQAALGEVLARQQQAILFLNRRGSATYVFCRKCGAVVRCPRCDLPLTFHEGRQSLECHTCNYRRQMPKRCSECGSDQIRQYGAGVEKVEAEVQRLFPSARTLRWDAETARHKGAHDLLLSHFVHHRADVLIGTQMLAKSLDLPLVTLVGVVLADVGLNFPDFRAAERTFQLLTQVAGRAGRSSLGGQVFLQTFQPDAAAIQFAARYDWAGFYAWELEQRRKIGYPPFARLVRLEYRDETAEAARKATEALAQRLRLFLEEEESAATRMIGPVPCYYERLDGKFRWQILLSGPQPTRWLRRYLPLGEQWRVEVDPMSVL